MWISKARWRVLRSDADKARQLTGLLAAEREAHRLTRLALEKRTEQAKALDERLESARKYAAVIEADLAAARKGSWRWTDSEGDHSATP